MSAKLKKPAPKSIFSRLADLYARMEAAYGNCAEAAGLSCAGCENNCCTSFFQHHTYIEWLYLHRGLGACTESKRREFTARAAAYVEDSRARLAEGRPPSAMCPLNESGLCGLYSHRLMICRMHGTRNVLSLPDGSRREFSGCFRFTSLPAAQSPDCPSLDRTPFYRELAALEGEILARAKQPLPRVSLTLAEMVVSKPPFL